MTIKSIQTLVSEAMSEIKTISADEAHKMMEDNNCNLIADTAYIPNFNLQDLSTVEHIVYSNGNNNVSNELFKIINGEHTWPGKTYKRSD